MKEYGHGTIVFVTKIAYYPRYHQTHLSAPQKEFDLHEILYENKCVRVNLEDEGTQFCLFTQLPVVNQYTFYECLNKKTREIKIKNEVKNKGKSQ